jgi:O-antigen/teichoic acid export membrane protein
LFFVVALWLTNRWRPKFLFDRETFYFHWKHGARLLVVSLTGAIYRNTFSLIIGKFFSSAQLGFYNRADSFRSIIYNNTITLIQGVSYPVMARVQEDPVVLKKTYRKVLQSTMFAILPVAGTFIFAAKDIIQLLLTEKWLPAAPILQVLMLALIFSPFNSINLNILKVKRRTDLLLRADLINKALLIITVLSVFHLGFNYLILSNLFVALLALFINNYFVNRLIGYSIWEQLYDIWYMIASIVAALALAYALGQYLYIPGLMVRVGAKVIAVGAFYLSFNYLLNRRFLYFVFDTVRDSLMGQVFRNS